MVAILIFDFLRTKREKMDSHISPRNILKNRFRTTTQRVIREIIAEVGDVERLTFKSKAKPALSKIKTSAGVFCDNCNRHCSCKVTNNSNNTASEAANIEQPQRINVEMFEAVDILDGDEGERTAEEHRDI